MEAREVSYLLHAHARTFALTLAILPRSLRKPLGVAYLLARASDTIADAGKISRARRVALLEELESALAGGSPALWSPVMMPGELDESRAKLFAAVPLLISQLERSADRDELLKLWRLILEGQLFDLRRFPSDEPLKREELARYCFLVAGSVGECWTALIAKHSPCTLLRSEEEMKRLGCDYGKGLQLLNILRDRAEDRAMGRDYVEEGDLAELFELAEAWLRSGEKYLTGLRPGRLLMGTALPYDLALPTLWKMKQSPDVARVRISRRDVRSVVIRAAASLCLPRRMNPAS